MAMEDSALAAFHSNHDVIVRMLNSMDRQVYNNGQRLSYLVSVTTFLIDLLLDMMGDESKLKEARLRLKSSQEKLQAAVAANQPPA